MNSVGKALLLSGIVLANSAFGFETQTHALMTREAYARSQLATDAGGLLKRLGLDRLYRDDRFQMYWDADVRSRYYKDGGQSGGDIQAIDYPAGFEACQMRDFLVLDEERDRKFGHSFVNTVHSAGNPNLYPIQNWLVRGAIREDDMGPTILGWYPLLNVSRCAWEWFLTVPDQPNYLPRSFQHFYDPEFDRGLSVLQIPQEKSVDWALGYEDSFVSPATPAQGVGRNTYSYLDARNAYWWALTRRRSKETGSPDNPANRASDSKDRMILWATMFRSLGNVVHLLQDAAQPQHTRLDPHSAKDGDQQQAFEGFTNARILGGDGVGSFVHGFYSSLEPEDLSIPPLGAYGSTAPVMFSIPLRFFTTRSSLGGAQTGFFARSGMADYSSRGFFTGGTLPGMEGDTPHQAPPQDFDNPANGYSISYSSCESAFVVDERLRAATCLHFLHAVPDTVNPDYAGSMDVLPPGFSLPNAPIAADGIFREFAMSHGSAFPRDISRVTWSPQVLETIGNLTIPRAIGYSAGLLDFFFRGEIELSSPPDGLYAVIDQGTPHHVEDGIPMDEAGLVFGFHALRVRVRNVTNLVDGNHTLRDAGTGEIVPQTMHSGVDSSGNPTGHLVAIARYHRNPCYQPDLSGEYVVMPDPQTGIPNPSDKRIPSGCALQDSRRAFVEISVSVPLQLDASGNLPGPPAGSINPCVNAGNINSGAHGIGSECENDAVLAQFDFSNDPIPINATDLFVQVAYRGPLGFEDDGIAVGSKDIDETNYITLWNGTDRFYHNGEWVAPEDFADVPDNVPWQPTPIDEALFCFAEQTIVDMAPGETVQPARFLRIGVLSDAQPVPFGIYAEMGLRGQFMTLSANRAQRQTWMEDPALASYNPAPFLWYGRGTVAGGNFLAPFYAYGEGSQDNTMQSLILNPPIGGGLPGFARPVTAGFDVAADKCKRVPPPPAG
ncbi:MAG: hypothetical protein E6Q43_06360 [Dokdonella sp.]|nr:MAG: hypothetical protein E6Q43_06360 [Dokdonella sp.]